MALTAGTHLGPYKITTPIGEGGMGQVYRATDTTLGRQVAIKILPDAFAADPERLTRFEREAKTLASLNHPHIAAIYGFEKSTGVQALVMELVEGEDLSQRIARGAIPIDEALPIAKQIAEALEAAHEQGIIHRDLKPANIKVRSDGTVKVLDFGLAKAMEPAAGSSPSMSMSPTLMSPVMSGIGVILGTAAYMAPEQAKGRAVDRRADIWAFGVVVYEMLTGKGLFAAEDVSETLAAVLTRTVDLAALPAATPPNVRRLVARCLDRDPRLRLRDIGEARIQLEEMLGGARSNAGAPLAPVDSIALHRGPVRGARVAWIVAGVALLTAAALAIPAVRHAREFIAEPLQTRFEIQTPPTSNSGSFALSPDGRQLALVATAEGAARLWVRSLDQVTARVLPGTDDAVYPFWAPDGTAIGFFANGKLKRIDLGGGSPQTLADAPTGRGGSWNREGVIIFTATNQLAAPTSVLMRVAATGGVPAPVTHLAAGQTGHRWPQFLPDGRRFLFFVQSSRPDTQGTYLGSLDGGEPTRVLASDTAAFFAPPNFLLQVRQEVLVAQRFDPVRGTVTGDPVPLAQPVGVDNGVFRAAFSTSSAGVLAHRTGSGGQRRQLQWVNRSGTLQGTVGVPDVNILSNPDLAPDGRRVAVARNVDANYDIWLIDVGRGVPSRFTFDASLDSIVVWSPDGQRVAFASSRNGVFDLFEKPSTGVGDEKPLLVTTEVKAPLSWSPDGKFLLYGSQDPKTGADLWALPLVGEPAEGRKPFPVVRTPFEESMGQFSPDGRWVAYQSNASGRMEIYVQPFPVPGRQWQVSTTGGNQPRWRPDGRELFYVAPDARLMAVPIAVGADRQTLEPGAPVPLFPTRLASGANVLTGALSKPQYAVAPDGRFLLNVAVEEEAAPPITVVLNWDVQLQK